jgi:hypothetical protein
MSIEGWQGQIHPAAELFPLMEGEEFESLVASIKEQGLREAIWVTADGQLLDGRNRVRACHAAGIEPTRRTFTGGDPVAFVMALNMERRHLTVGQRALVALKLVPMYQTEAAKRQAQAVGKPRGEKASVSADLHQQTRQRSTQQAGLAAKVSGRAVAQAKRVAEHAPDLVAKIESGKLALDRADRIVRDRDSAERRAAKATAQQRQLAVGTSVDVRYGDFRKVLSDLQDVDAIITDPPYPREFLPMLDDLRDFADKVLAPDGVLVVLFGQTYLPEVYRRLEGGRPYRWTGCYLTPGAGYASMAKRVQSNWKPVIVYGGGQRFGDVFRSEGADVAAKSYHHWGQDYSAFAQIVERLTMPGATVVDPFMGSGTTLLAAQALGRHAIGCDIDIAHVETAKERLNA